MPNPIAQRFACFVGQIVGFIIGFILYSQCVTTLLVSLMIRFYVIASSPFPDTGMGFQLGTSVCSLSSLSLDTVSLDGDTAVFHAVSFVEAKSPVLLKCN